MGENILTTELNDNKVIYHGGETVSGRLVFVNDESFNIDLVQITFSGKAHVCWTEGDEETFETFTGKQRLFKETICLSGSQKRLPSGRSTFPFSFELPQELPSSVEVSDGYVRYSVKGLVKRPEHHKSLATKAIFTVLDVLDLNQVHHAKYPSSESGSKNLCCWSCASGPIEVKVNTDKTGYVPGEFIKATGSIENLSNSDIRGSHFSIVQRITKHASGKSDAISTELVKAPGIPCKRRSTVQLDPQALQTDRTVSSRFANKTNIISLSSFSAQVSAAIPQSLLRFCKVMEIDYFLQLTIYTGACHYDLRVKAPLVMGTIPLRDNGTRQLATASVTVNTPETSFQSLASQPIASTSTAYRTPPPSYAEATSVNMPQKKITVDRQLPPNSMTTTTSDRALLLTNESENIATSPAMILE